MRGEVAHDAGYERVQLLDRPVVDVGVRGSSDLLLVGKQTLTTRVGSHARPSGTDLLRRRHDDDGVETRVGAGLVQQWNLDHRERRRIVPRGESLVPARVLGADTGMKQPFQPLERRLILENQRGDLCAVGRSEAVEESGSDLRILRQEAVDDLVARERRGAVARERAQRLGLAGPDPPCDGDP